MSTRELGGSLDPDEAEASVESRTHQMSSLCSTMLSMESWSVTGQESISGALTSAMTSMLVMDSVKLNSFRMPTSTDVGTSLRPTDGQIFEENGAGLEVWGCAENKLPTSIPKNKVVPVDFEYLLRRCDDDNQLAVEILRTFCEQGQIHLSAMHEAVKLNDGSGLLFHSVLPHSPPWFC